MNFIELISKKRKLIFLICFISGAVFLLWKMQYGYIFNDEPFILSLGHRFLKGDKLFVNEWNGTQLFSLINFPIIKVYSLIKNPVVELILFVRIIYVIWWLFVSYLIYRRLEQFGLVSVAAMLYFMLFTPLDNMSITYNVMSLSLFCIFTTYFIVKGNVVTDILTGVALAFAVIASPYSVVLYVAYATTVVFVNVTKLKNKPFVSAKIFHFKSFLNITIGASLVAIVFIAYLYWVGFDNVFNSFEMIFMYRKLPFANKLISIIKVLVHEYTIQTVFGMLVIMISFFDKKRYKHRFIYFIIQIMLWGITMAYIMINCFFKLNVIMMPLTVLGLQAYILTKNKNLNIFLSLWVSGIIFAISSNESSDTGILAVSMATTIAGIGSFLLIFLFAKEFNNESDKTKCLVVFGLMLIVCVQLGCQLVTRSMRNYLDTITPRLDTRISVGVAKGVITTKEKALKYEEIYDDLQIIKNSAKSDDNVLIASLFPSAYLDLDMNYGTYSSWTYINNSKNFVDFTYRLEKYYDLNKDKFPQYIYVLNEDEKELGLVDDVVNFENYDLVQGKRGMIFIEKKR